MYKICNHLIKNEIVVASILFLLPLINFINPINIKQLENSSLFFLFLFNLSLCFIFLLIIFLIKNFLKKSIDNIYLISSLFYLSLFLHNDVKTLIDKINIYIFNSWRIEKINSLYFNEISILLILLVIYVIIYFQRKFIFFKEIFKTFLIFLVSTNFILVIYNFYSFKKNIDREQLELKNLNLLKLNKSNNKIVKKNVYYIVFDGLISLENAYEQKVFKDPNDILDIKNKLKDLKIEYIPESTSNYNYTYLTLSSIFYLNSPLDEKSPKYKDNAYLFPLMLNKRNLNVLEKKNLTILPKILDKNDYKFYYFGNSWHQCVNDDINNINCFGKSSNKFLNSLEVFYSKTPIIQFTQNLFKYSSKENTSSFFLNNLETIHGVINRDTANHKKGNFIFVHSIIPHDPYLDKNCNYNDIFSLTSYSYSYSCVLKKIFDITNFLNQKDPSALIIFQSDHGWVNKFSSNVNRDDFIYSEKTIINGKLNKNIKKEFNHRASIFNGIKASDECFKKNGVPLNNANTIKFVFNCIFNYDLNYQKNNHFIGLDAKDPDNYGKLFKLK